MFKISLSSYYTLSKYFSATELEGDVLVAQAAVFFTAGFGTSSLTMSFTLHSLSYNPEIQIKLRKEIQSVIARNGGKFTYDCLQEMKYLDACVKGKRTDTNNLFCC